MDFRHLIVTCLFSKLRLPFDNQKVKENYAIFWRKSTNNYMRFPIDIFAFTYYCGGINFIDIAHLTQANIIEGRLIYKRHKTGKLIKIPLCQQALELIKKYHCQESPYLFPILFGFHETEIQKANRIHKVITKVNKRLKEIGEELNLPITLTTYVARHS